MTVLYKVNKRACIFVSGYAHTHEHSGSQWISLAWRRRLGMVTRKIAKYWSWKLAKVRLCCVSEAEKLPRLWRGASMYLSNREYRWSGMYDDE